MSERVTLCFHRDTDILTYEESDKLIDKVTHEKQAAVLDFVRRVILAYVTGNNDLHLKKI